MMSSSNVKMMWLYLDADSLPNARSYRADAVCSNITNSIKNAEKDLEKTAAIGNGMC